MPGSWQWRSTLQNVLRVAWMDVFERAGWSVVSMWNCNTCASNSSLHELALVAPSPPTPKTGLSCTIQAEWGAAGAIGVLCCCTCSPTRDP